MWRKRIIWWMCIISRRSGVFVTKFELKQQIFLVGKYLLKVKWIITCSKSTKKTLDKLSLKALVPLLLTSNRYLSTRYLLVSLAFLSGFSFTNIHDSKDSREDGWLSLWLLSAISTCFTDTKTSAGQLLQGTHLCS